MQNAHEYLMRCTYEHIRSLVWICNDPCLTGRPQVNEPLIWRFQSSHAWTFWLAENEILGESFAGERLSVFVIQLVTGVQRGFPVRDDVFTHVLSLPCKKILVELRWWMALTGYAIRLTGTLPPNGRKIVGGGSLIHDSEIPKLLPIWREDK